MRPDIYALAETLLAPTAAPDVVAVPEDLAGIRALLQTMLGQRSMPSGQWRMSAYQSAIRIDALMLRCDANDQVNAIQEQRFAALQAGAATTSEQVLALTARLDLVQAFAQATQLELAKNGADDALAQARLAHVEQQQAADRLADAALAAHEAKQDADLALLAARASTDEALIAATQVAATAAQARAEQAITAAAAAQSSASSAGTAATQAQTTATAAQQAAASNAQALAQVQADVATRLPASMVQRFSITTPAVTIQVGTPATFNVVLPKAFADNLYFAFFTKATGSALLNVQLSDTAKLPGSFTATMQQTGLTSLLVPPSTAEVFVIHA